MASKNPTEVYGSLKEGVHIAGYTFERAFANLDWLLKEDRWKTVGGGFSDVNKFVASVQLDNFRVLAEQRRSTAKAIKALQPAVSNRAHGEDDGGG